MKKHVPYLFVFILLVGFYFALNNVGSDDRTFRDRDVSIQKDFTKLRLDYLQGSINQTQYINGVKFFAKKERDLIEEVRNHKFENITESNYWHRSRLKFPSNIKIELEIINKLEKDS